MPDFVDDIVDGWVGGHGYNIEVSEDRIVDELKAAIRERCVEKPSAEEVRARRSARDEARIDRLYFPPCEDTEDGPTRVIEGGEATVNKDTGMVRIAAGKGIVNGEPVSWEASEQAYELIEKPSAEDGDEDGR